MKIRCSVGKGTMEAEECLACALKSVLPPWGFEHSFLRKLYKTMDQDRPGIHVSDLVHCPRILATKSLYRQPAVEAQVAIDIDHIGLLLKKASLIVINIGVDNTFGVSETAGEGEAVLSTHQIEVEAVARQYRFDATHLIVVAVREAHLGKAVTQVGEYRRIIAVAAIAVGNQL